MKTSRRLLLPTFLLPALLLPACGDEEHDHDHDHEHDMGGTETGADAGTDMGPDTGMDMGTDVPTDPVAVSIPFVAVVDGQPAACGTAYTGLGATAAAAQLADARLYLTDVALRDAAGTWVPVSLDASIWQNEGVALLDFEDGTGACADSGTTEMNDMVVGTIAPGEYDALRFTVGIPFEQNHLDSAAAAAPLNAPGMFWAWQGGYKFVRVDWAVEGGAVPRWNVHIGSTGCISDAATIAPAEECGRPNRSSAELEGFELGASTVQIDLGALVAGADVMVNLAESPPGCMSSPSEAADCDTVASALGLAFDTGACAAECAGQTIFTLAE